MTNSDQEDPDSWAWELQTIQASNTDAGPRRIANTLAQRPDGWWLRVEILKDEQSLAEGIDGPHPSKARAQAVGGRLSSHLQRQLDEPQSHH